MAEESLLGGGGAARQQQEESSDGEGERGSEAPTLGAAAKTAVGGGDASSGMPTPKEPSALRPGRHDRGFEEKMN